MKKYLFNILLLLCCCMALLPLYAQPVSDSTQQAAPDHNGKLRIVPLPVLYYTPETRFGFGALAAFNFKIGDPARTRTSNIQVYGLYTLNKQLDTNLEHTLFTRDEKYFIKGRLSYLYFPEFYYGIGNNLPESNKEQVEYKRLRLEQRVMKKLGARLFGGLQFRLSNLFNVKTAEGGLLETRRETGYRGYLVSGLGYAFVYDTRDNILNSYKGMYLEMTNYNYLRLLGSDYNYSSFTLDVRRYLNLLPKRNIILALHGYGNFIVGPRTPFKELSELGNSWLMRGYYRGRFRGNHYVAAQAELRVPLWWRIGVVGFAGMGTVSNAEHRIELNQLKPNYGAGLRFQVDKRDRVNIRLDYGFGSKGIQSFYLDITEAF